MFGGKLHCVHRGAGEDTALRHTTFDGTRWSTDTKLRHHHTASNPALAAYDGKLHLLHRGAATDTSLWHAAFDGTRWSADTQMPHHSSLEGPSLAAFDGHLYCVHRGHGNGDQKLWWATYKNSSGWSADREFHGHTSGTGPAVIAYRDANAETDQFLVVHRGYGPRAAGSDAAEMKARIAAEELTAAEPGTD
ncbi:hypothetical protein AB0F11_25985 [Streptomyces sp. NPDC032472]|uniref:hypothetical protein n=1 Tax=Streptomyces sp. NPDC032472 TaxID=3155018 RepID=UPI0033C0B879